MYDKQLNLNVKLLKKILKSDKKNGQMIRFMLNNIITKDIAEIKERKRNKCDPDNGWWLTDDICNYSVHSKHSDEDSSEHPASFCSRSKLNNMVKHINKIQLQTGELIESRTYTRKKGYGGLPPVAYRLNPNKEALLTIWLTYIQLNQHEMIFNSDYRKSNPSSLEIVAPIFILLNHYSQTFSKVKYHETTTVSDQEEPTVIDLALKRKTTTFQANKEYHEWLDDLQKIRSIKPIIDNLREIYKRNIVHGITETFYIKYAVRAVAKYTEKEQKKTSLLEYLRSHPKEKKLLVLHLKKSRKYFTIDIKNAQKANHHARQKTLNDLEPKSIELIKNNSDLITKFYLE